ncbi:chemotaxis protein CheD [Pseudoroseicyclus tamaricis]|uniref:Probable chemoreceptor glutamine deamidase CheD n=1 Tax=Pseudoroseicyclus tamaricis TaxID=2705421 RepID=A0A6B2JVC7_9RHOB|nr:chemotaxis protein CheD [Pseudoroseicyclus tamaricis]NDV01845.1 chemotaxis protein CheD [Pseudoroseicyclus tamaricis]
MSHIAMGGKVVTIFQGEFHVSDDPGAVINTLLGSCIAVCLHEPQRRIGGMNHFLLPEGQGGSTSPDVKQGAHAMELLINDMIKRGAMRSKLTAKVFGAGRITQRFSYVSEANIAFVRQFLRAENIPCLAESVGGESARRIRFEPVTGDARQMLVPRSDAKEDLRPVRPPPPAANPVELF